MEWLNSIDIQLFQLINGAGYEQKDNVMVLISGKLTWIPLYLLLLYLLYKKFSAKFIWVLISLGVLIFVADYGSVHFFKEVFQRLRPCHQLDNIRIVAECGGLYSFVSSHAANTFAIAFFMGLMLNPSYFLIYLFFPIIFLLTAYQFQITKLQLFILQE